MASDSESLKSKENVLEDIVPVLISEEFRGGSSTDVKLDAARLPDEGRTTGAQSHHDLEASRVNHGKKTEENKTPEVDTESEAWEFLLESTEKSGKEKVEAWKSELDTLLVFAGLLSAVVTSFTVDSYKNLQEDPSETAAQALTRISSQLSSLVVTQGFINSTVEAFPPPAAFTPDPLDVKLNLLWFLSLTLSLTAAFLAIAVQQWLRAIPEPQHLSVQHVVVLRQHHYSSLIYWQVPNIVLVLAVLLQASVVLFLVGLFLLLRSLSHSITVAFSAVAGIPFFLYAISVLLPLKWPKCPYKSPIVPSAAFVYNCFAYVIYAIVVPPVSLALGIIVFILDFALRIVLCVTCCAFNIPFGCCFRDICQPLYEVLMQPPGLIATLIQSLLPTPKLMHMKRREKMPSVRSVAEIVLSVISESNEFWTRRSISYFFRNILVQKESLEESRLQCFMHSLVRAPEAIPSYKIDHLRSLFLAVGTAERARCVLQWVIGQRVLYEALPHVNVDLILRIGLPPLIEPYRPYLLLALPNESDWGSACDWVSDQDGQMSLVLILLSRLFFSGVTESDFGVTVAGTLVQVCSHQDEKSLWDNRYPTLCLFECCYAFSKRYPTVNPFSHSDISDLVALTTKCSALVARHVPSGHTDLDKDVLDATETFLSAAASAMYALSLTTPDNSTDPIANSASSQQIQDVRQQISIFFDVHKQHTLDAAAYCVEDMEGPLVVTPRVVQFISASVQRLEDDGRLPDRSANGVAGSLRSAGSSENAFAIAMQPPGSLQEFLTRSQPAPVSPMQAPEVDAASTSQLALDEPPSSDSLGVADQEKPASLPEDTAALKEHDRTSNDREEDLSAIPPTEHTDHDIAMPTQQLSRESSSMFEGGNLAVENAAGSDSP